MRRVPRTPSRRRLIHRMFRLLEREVAALEPATYRFLRDGRPFPRRRRR